MAARKRAKRLPRLEELPNGFLPPKHSLVEKTAVLTEVEAGLLRMAASERAAAQQAAEIQFQKRVAPIMAAHALPAGTQVTWDTRDGDLTLTWIAAP